MGEIPSGFFAFDMGLPWSSWTSLVVPALVIALVGFTEAAAIASVYAAEDRARWEPNREFLSQGVANLVAGFAGAFPVGASFGRSSVNRLAGARTRWSGAVTGLAVLLFIPVSGVLEGLPTTVLAAIVIVAVIRLIAPQRIVPIWRQSKLQGFVAGFTLIATLGLSPRIDIAVVLGIGLAIVVHLGREMRVDVTTQATNETLTISPKGVVFFGSTPRLVESLLDSLSRHQEVSTLILDLAGVGRLDFTGGDALRAVISDAKAAGLDVRIDNTPPHAERIVTGLLEELGAGITRTRSGP